MSAFERPHRLLPDGTYAAPWLKNQTDVALFFEAVSGNSITYVAENDLNGDGIDGNVPIFVPKNATVGGKVRIGSCVGSTSPLNSTSGTFEQFTKMLPCVDRRRGTLMNRNSCYGPFRKRMDVSVRQTLPERFGQRLTMQLDIFNFPNLLNSVSGRNYFSLVSTFNNSAVLNTAGRTTGALSVGQWNYYLVARVQNAITNKHSPWWVSTNSATNRCQIQMTLRYAIQRRQQQRQYGRKMKDIDLRLPVIVAHYRCGF